MKDNDAIGFIAPSFGCNIEPYRSAFDNAQKKFRSLGYELHLGPNCYEGQGIGISNTPEKCGEEVNDFFINKPGKAIFSCGGGELMCEILDYVDFERIKKAESKWYVGYSDNTNLTFLLATLCDVASIYGPCAPAFGMEPWHDSLEHLMGILTGNRSCVSGYPLWERESKKDETHPLEPYHVTEPRILKMHPKQPSASMEGRLLGGCLDCLGKLVGTKYDRVADFADRYKEEGIIWYMEACELNVMDIRRTLWQLDHAGWFRHVRGFFFWQAHVPWGGDLRAGPIQGGDWHLGEISGAHCDGFGYRAYSAHDADGEWCSRKGGCDGERYFHFLLFLVILWAVGVYCSLMLL